jgi:hypothetical protein
MVPPNLGDVWDQDLCHYRKITWPTVLDLRSSVSAIPKSLCDHLDLPLLKSVILT